jgi:hypothetical protein
MPDKPPRLPRHDNFANFEAVPGASRPRRRGAWWLRPVHEAGDSATADASRFLKEAELMQGHGRREPE